MGHHSPPYRGVWPAMLTPYDAQDRVNLPAVRRLVGRFIEERAGGIYICGSTGEGPLLRVEERKAIAECVVAEVAGQIPVMVHVGHTAPVLAVELAEHAQRIRADAVSSILPPFYRYETGQVVDYWLSLARRCELPFYGYVMHDIGQSEPQVAQWVEAIRRVPTLVGLKFTNESAYQLALLKSCSGGALNILSGADQAFLACRAQGADGAVGSSYNVALPLWRHVDELYAAGDTAAASEWMVRCAQLVGRFASRYFMARLKWIIRRQGIDCGPPRSPLAPDTALPEAEMEALYAHLTELTASIKPAAKA